MVITMNDIKYVFKKLISGEISLEEADELASYLMAKNDSYLLVFEPRKDKDNIWDAISYLGGIDMKTSPNEYLYTIEEIEETFNEKWNI